MGQRLNIEINRKKDGKTLANCYYHWSAYTQSSLMLAQTILDNLIEFRGQPNDKMKAINLLQTTGAGLEEEDYETLTEEEKKVCRVGKNRNLGLIAISKKNIQETRDYEEYELTIDLDETELERDNIEVLFSPKTSVNFGVYWRISREHIDKEINADNLVEFDFDLQRMTRKDIDTFLTNIRKIEDNGGYFTLKQDKYNYYGIIY